MRRLLHLGLAMVMVMLIVACSDGGATSGRNVPAPAAPAEPTVRGRLTLYSALDRPTTDALVAAFRRRYPDVEFSIFGAAAAGEVAARLQAEREAPKADIFIGGDTAIHEGLANMDLLLPYRSPVAAQLDPHYVDPDGRFTGWYIGVLGIVINTDRFKDIQLPEPRTWDDLLDPRWQGKLVFPSPPTTGGGYVFLADQVFRFNRDEMMALEFMKRLDGNVAQYTQRSPDAALAVAQGDYVGAMNWVHDIIAQKKKGFPVKAIIPPDTAYEVGGISIVKGGANPDAAKAFVDWVLGPEAGKINTDSSNRLSVRSDVPAPEGVVTLSDVKLVNYDRSYAAEQRDRLLRAWQVAVGR